MARPPAPIRKAAPRHALAVCSYETRLMLGPLCKRERETPIVSAPGLSRTFAGLVQLGAIFLPLTLGYPYVALLYLVERYGAHGRGPHKPHELGVTLFFRHAINIYSNYQTTITITITITTTATTEQQQISHRTPTVSCCVCLSA